MVKKDQESQQYHRAVGWSENPGVPVSFGGHNLPPLLEIGLTDLPKYWGAMAHKGLKLPKRFTNLPFDFSGYPGEKGRACI